MFPAWCARLFTGKRSVNVGEGCMRVWRVGCDRQTGFWREMTVTSGYTRLGPLTIPPPNPAGLPLPFPSRPTDLSPEKTCKGPMISWRLGCVHAFVKSCLTWCLSSASSLTWQVVLAGPDFRAGLTAFWRQQLWYKQKIARQTSEVWCQIPES